MFNKLVRKSKKKKLYVQCCVGRLSSNVRILWSLLIILLVFVVTTALVKMDTSNCREAFFISTLASVAVVSGASNVFSGSMFGISGHFPMRISQALISGIVLSQDCFLFPLLQKTLMLLYKYLSQDRQWEAH